MTEQVWSDEHLKELFKTAVIEVLEERRELLRDLMEETLEDFALFHAIREGAATRVIDPGDVYRVLEGKP